MNKRDKLGMATAFALGLLLNSIGTVIMVLRECWQAYKHNFAIETADVVRYSLLSAIGAVINTVILLILLILC